MADSRNNTNDTKIISKKKDYTEITRNSFDKDFVFGTGTSAYQVEGAAAKGGRGLSVWDVFTLSKPGNVEDGSNGNMAVDMYNRYKEDIKNMKNMGFDAYRFSISWPRILPGGKHCYGINQEGIDHYNDLIDTLIAHGIEPHVTLFHWDLPHTLEQEYKGFLSDKIVDDFRDFAELCFREFGDRVKRWTTLNEPWSYCISGYVLCTFPPAKGVPKLPKKCCPEECCVTKKAGAAKLPDRVLLSLPLRGPEYCLAYSHSDGKTTSIETKDGGTISMSEKDEEAFIAAKNMLLAHVAAVESYQTHFKALQEGQIGITLLSMWCEPYDSKYVEDHRAARRGLDFMLGWFLEPVLNGEYPKSMKECDPLKAQFCEEESKKFKENKIDFLGLNYYTATYVKNNSNPDGKLHPYIRYQCGDLEKVNKDSKPIGEETELHWLKINPRGIYKLLEKVKEIYDKFGLPDIYITENGMAELNKPELTASEACADPVRVKYFQDHLRNILDAINIAQVKVVGYFAWSWVDNFEWAEGYTMRFGINYVDYKDHLKRYPKHSALWFSKFLIRSKEEKKEKEKDNTENDKKGNTKEDNTKKDEKNTKKDDENDNTKNDDEDI